MKVCVLVGVVAALSAIPSYAQEYDDPAVTVCELLIRPEYEIEKNIYRRVSGSVNGSKAILDFEWGVAGARPKAMHVECPFRFENEKWVLDFPTAEQSKLSETPGYRSISASGIYPIPTAGTALH